MPISCTTLCRLWNVEGLVALTEFEPGGVNYLSLGYRSLAQTREMGNMVDGETSRYSGPPEMIQVAIWLEDN